MTQKIIDNQLSSKGQQDIIHKNSMNNILFNKTR